MPELRTQAGCLGYELGRMPRRGRREVRAAVPGDLGPDRLVPLGFSWLHVGEEESGVAGTRRLENGPTDPLSSIMAALRFRRIAPWQFGKRTKKHQVASRASDSCNGRLHESTGLTLAADIRLPYLY